MTNQQGLVALLIGIAAMLLTSTLALSSVFVFLNRAKAQKNIALSYGSFFAEEAGMEDALYRVTESKQYLSSYTLTLNNSLVDLTILGGDTKTVTVRSDRQNVFRNAQAIITLSTTEAEFFYGVQVGEGGVTMSNNSRIEGAGGTPGNFYSNGPVFGQSGATITGSVTVASGVSADAQHEVYNSDFAFGMSQGSRITTVDSAGDVGSYASLAVGADGFARISYIDTTNQDLAFVRCTNDDCSTRIITTLDSTGEINETTSLVLGADGFARVSYYHDGNDDLKFIQCLNADCTSRNTTTVDAPGNTGDDSALAFGLDGLPRIAYLDDSGNNLRFARCTNADCTARNMTTVDASGIVGEPHIALAIGADGFARISYYEDGPDDDLKFARCTNDDCTSRVLTTVDSLGRVGQYTSIVMGSDGFARISYFHESDGDLKFVRCTNDACTASVITTVDSAGSVGQYTSLELGSDGFARIAYFYSGSDDDLKFARCSDADCITKNISTVDSSGDVGRYASLGLGTDGFGRIAYYDQSNRDLKYVRCLDANCPAGVLPGDIGQSFQPTQSEPLAKVALYIRKVGSPSTATVRINSDLAGSPNTSSLVSVSLDSNSVGTSYGWVEVSFPSPINVGVGTTYWLVFDGNQDTTNYYELGYDSSSGYPDGSAKYSEDWNSKPWFSISGDMNFTILLGTGASSIDGVIVYGTVRANTITNSSICGDAYYQAVATIDLSSKTFLDSPSNPTCGGNALTPGTGFPGQPDPAVSQMPISDSNINQWKADAQAGGTTIGDFSVASDTSLGPREITGNLLMAINNLTLTVTGTVYVRGNIDISGNNSTIRCGPSYGVTSCVVVTDGWIHTVNNNTFGGSGEAGSYIMFLTTLVGCNGAGGMGCTHHDGAIDLHNNALGAIFYAANSQIYLHNGVNASELVAYKLVLDNNAIITYENGLASAHFQGGPGASWSQSDWKEVE